MDFDFGTILNLSHVGAVYSTKDLDGFNQADDVYQWHSEQQNKMLKMCINGMLWKNTLNNRC